MRRKYSFIWIVICAFLVLLTACGDSSGRLTEDAAYYVPPNKTTEAVVSVPASESTTEADVPDTTEHEIYDIQITMQANPEETSADTGTEFGTDGSALETSEPSETEEETTAPADVPSETDAPVISEETAFPETAPAVVPETAPPVISVPEETAAPVQPTAAPAKPDPTAPAETPAPTEAATEAPTSEPETTQAETESVPQTAPETTAEAETTEIASAEASTEDMTEAETEPTTETESASVEETTAQNAETDPDETVPETASETETESETVPATDPEPETTQEETTEAATQAAVVPAELKATVRKAYYVGDTLAARDFIIEVVMSDGTVLTNPQGWTAAPLVLSNVTNDVTVAYDTLSIVLNIPAQERPQSTLPAGINHAVIQSAVNRLGSGYKMGARKTTAANYRLFDCATLVWACLEENGIHNMPGGTALWIGNIRNRTLNLNYNNRVLPYVYCATPEAFVAAANDPANVGKCIVLTTPCNHNTLGAIGALREGAIEVYYGHIALIVGQIAPPKKINGSGLINNNYSVAKYAQQAFNHLSKYYAIPNPEGMVHVLGQLSTETYQADVNGHAGSSGAYTLANKPAFRQVGGASDPGHNIWSYNLFTANAQQPWSVLHNFTQFANAPYGDGTVWKIEALTERWGVTYTNNCGGFEPGDVNAYVVYLKDQ